MVKRLTLFLLAGSLFVGLYATWQFTFPGLPLRRIVFPASLSDPEPQVLARPVVLDIRQATIADIATEFESQLGIPIRFEFDLAWNVTQWINLQTQSIPAYQALDLIADQVDSDAMWVWHRNAVIFHSRGSWRTTITRYDARLHSVGPLIGQISALSQARLPSLIEAVVTPDGWEWSGGLGQSVPHPGGLLVAQTPRAHRRIERLLAGLTRATDRTQPLDPLWVADSAATEARYRRLEKTLHQPGSLDCEAVAAEVVLSQFAEQYDLPLVVDRRGCLEEGIDWQQEVSLHLSDVPLRAILDAILMQTRTTYTFYGGQIYVVPRSRSDDQVFLLTRIYPLHDLLGSKERASHSAPPLEERLASFLPTTVECHWMDAGGDSYIDACEALVVRAPLSVHFGFERWMSDFRRAVYLPVESNNRFTNRAHAIEQKLRERVTLHFQDISTREALRRLARQHQLNIVIDEQSVQDDWIDIVRRDCEVVAYDQPLEQVMERVLTPKMLEMSLHDSVLWVRTRDPGNLESRFYEIPRWVIDREFGHDVEANQNRILWTFTDPKLWTDNGGDGNLGAFESTICVHNTRAVHAQISRLLASLELMEQCRIAGDIAPISVKVDSPAIEDALAEELSQPIRLEFHEASLLAVLEWIRERTGVHFQIATGLLQQETSAMSPVDIESVGEDSLKSSHRITISLPELTLETALHRLLASTDLAFVTRGKNVVIAEIQTKAALETHVYDIAGLADSSVELEAIVYLARNIAGWKQSALHWVQPAGDNLIVRQTPEAHQALQETLTAIRVVDRSQQASWWLAESIDDALHQVLSQPVTLVAEGQTIPELLDTLESEYEVAIDRDVLREPSPNPFDALRGSPFDVPQFRAFYHAPLGEVLEQLSPTLLAVTGREGKTDLRWKNSHNQHVRVYPIGDLLNALDDMPLVGLESQSIDDVPHGGPIWTGQGHSETSDASIQSMLELAGVENCYQIGGQLVVAGLFEQHRLAQETLAVLGEMWGLREADPGARRVRERRFNYACRDKRLTEFLRDISERTGSSIVLDPITSVPSMAFSGIVTCSATDVTADSLLREVFRGRDLQVVLDLHQVRITPLYPTQEECRIYSLAEVRQRLPRGSSLEAVMRHCLPSRLLHVESLFVGDALVVVASAKGLAEIEQFLLAVEANQYPVDLAAAELSSFEVEKLLYFLRNSDDEPMVAFGLLLFGPDQIESLMAIRGLIDVLERAVKEQDSRRVRQVAAALARYKTLPDEETARVAGLLASPDIPIGVSAVLAEELIFVLANSSDRRVLPALAAIGSARMADIEYPTAALLELQKFGPAPSRVIAPLVRSLPTINLTPLIRETLLVIDPELRESRRLLERWSREENLTAAELGGIRGWLEDDGDGLTYESR